MGFNLSSFFSSSMALMLLLFALEFILYFKRIFFKFGILCLHYLVIFMLIRGFLPFDFHAIKLTTSYYSHQLLPYIQTIFDYNLSIMFFSLTLEHLVLSIWFIGSFIHIIKRIHGYIFFNKALNSLKECCDKEIISICNEEFFLIFKYKYANFKIVQTDLIGTPAIFGLFHPIIILPDLKYTKEELEFIFIHELTHLKHKDFFVKIATDLLIAIHWWNPYLKKKFFYVINQVQEIYVDYEVNKKLSKSDKICYLNVLSKSIEYQSHHKTETKQVYALVDSHFGKNMIQRLECIINSNMKGFTLKGIVFSFFLFLLSFTFIFEPSFEPIQDENGDKVFYANEKESFYIWNGETYDLYLDGEYIYTIPYVHEDFKNFKIYNEEELK